MLLKFIETFYLDSTEKNINLIANLDLSSYKSELEDTLNKNIKFIKRSKKNEPLLEIADHRQWIGSIEEILLNGSKIIFFFKEN